MRDIALETLADPDGVLILDEEGFLKQDKAYSDAGRQYTCSAGKITNCQIGAFAAYVSRHGHAFIDRSTTGPIVHWPISTRSNMTTNEPAYGPGVC